MKIIGHRGAAGLAPENTKASFIMALGAGVDLVELDIRTSADGQLVVHHDPAIGKTKIASTDFDNLKILKPDLLKLDEAMAIIAHKCPVLIEVKKGTNIPYAMEKLKKLELPADVQYCSFYMPALIAIKATFPEAIITVNEKWSGVRGTYRCRKLGTKYIGMNQRWLWFGFIRSMSNSGYKLSAYPLNNPFKARIWAKYGLYAAVTDYPDRF